MALPYKGPVSELYAKRITSAVSRCYEKVQARVVLTSKAIFPAAKKDVLPTRNTNMLVYQYTCDCGHSYVGKTTQRLQDRINQHLPKSLVKILGTPRSRLSSSSSAIAQHLCWSQPCGEKYDSNQFTILARGRTAFHVSILESLYIARRRPILCKQKQYVYTTKLFAAKNLRAVKE